MSAANVGAELVATGLQLATVMLDAYFSRPWNMERRRSLAGAHRRRENSPPEVRRSRHSHLSQSNMRSEEKRLRTFRDWPDTVPAFPEDLAAAGFFFVGPEDRVQCFCCGGVLYDWLPEDDPLAEHKKFFPTCHFIQGKNVGNQPMLRAEETLDRVDGQLLGTLQRLSVEEASGEAHPEYPGMELESDRLATFGNWPAYAQVPPEPLVKAGFFYTGERDYVRCFYCNGALSNWERGDDPWMEHFRWFPRCKFLLQSRGAEFVNDVQDPDSDSLASPEDTVYWPEQQPESSEDSVDNLDLVSPGMATMVQNAIQMGFPPDLVLNLVPSKCVDTGRARYPSLSELVLDLLQAGKDEGIQEANRGESSPSMEEKLHRLQQERMCKVCMDKDVSVVLVPCGHLVVCTECAPNLRHCPICRGAIRDTIKAFLS